MFDQGARIAVVAGRYAGMWATVSRSTVWQSWPLVTAVVDGSLVDTGYSFHVRDIRPASTSTAIAIREI